MCYSYLVAVYYYIFTLFRVYHATIIWWFLPGFWVRASLLKFPVLFLIFWPILIMQPFRWSPLFLLFLSLSDLVPILWWLYRTHQLQFVSPLMFHSFFQFSIKVKVIISVFAFFHFYSMISRTAKSTIQQVLFFTLPMSGHLDETRWFVCISKSRRILFVSFSRVDSGLGKYNLFVWSNLNHLQNAQLITFPTQSCQILYSLCTSLLPLFIMWSIVSSLSPYNILFLFLCVVSVFASMYFSWWHFWAATRRDSVYL